MDSQSPLLELKQWMSSQIIGQERLVERILIALLSDGHLLVEGAPGLAKTKAIRALASGMDASFQRIQFTPDLLPGDITGTDIYRPEKGEFEFQPGPVFHNLLLADEINRAPAKVQSALLEAMSERQVSVGNNTRKLPDLFMVMATQNPLEQEGTYPLPEAQLDRFLLHVLVDYPDVNAELEIMRLVRAEAAGIPEAPNTLSPVALVRMRAEILQLHMAEAVEEYIAQLVVATRQAEKYDPRLGEWIEVGGSPRASLALDRCSRAIAWLDGRDFVSPDDVQSIAHDVLRHRLILSFAAEADGVSRDQVIDRLLELVPVA